MYVLFVYYITNSLAEALIQSAKNLQKQLTVSKGLEGFWLRLFKTGYTKGIHKLVL